MKKTKWKGYLNYSALDFEWGWEDILHPKFDEITNGAIPVIYFSVTGGVTRRIEIPNADDMILASEMEQARSYKNLRLYLNPKSAFAGAELMKMAAEQLSVNIQFCLIGHELSRQLVLKANSAKVLETPKKMSSASTNEEFLFVNFGYSDAYLEYFSPKSGESGEW